MAGIDSKRTVIVRTAFDQRGEDLVAQQSLNIAILLTLIALAVFGIQEDGLADDGGIPLDHPEFNFPLRESRLKDVEEDVSDWLAEKPANFSWLVLLTDQSGNDGGAGFAQVSVENDRIGIDHVLNIDRHHSLESEFKTYANSQGYEIEDLERNGVRYLRVLTENPAGDIEQVLRQVHGVNDYLILGVFGRVESPIE